ncbi:DEAD/DEAH box helicase, partial [Pseudomonas syringae pv. pisi str. 1704B]
MNDLTVTEAVNHFQANALYIGLTEFIEEFGDELLESLNRSNPPVYAGIDNPARQRVMDGLKRQPFPA